MPSSIEEPERAPLHHRFYHREGATNTRPCAGNVLKDARKTSGLCQYQVAQLLSYKTKEDTISDDTISNWECNRAMPDPEQVAILEEVYGQPGLWDAWMRQQYPSYHKRVPIDGHISDTGMAVVNASYQMDDVQDLTEDLARDLADGRLDDLNGAERYIREAREAAAAILAACDKLKGAQNHDRR